MPRITPCSRRQPPHTSTQSPSMGPPHTSNRVHPPPRTWYTGDTLTPEWSWQRMGLPLIYPSGTMPRAPCRLREAPWAKWTIITWIITTWTTRKEWLVAQATLLRSGSFWELSRSVFCSSSYSNSRWRKTFT